MALTQPILNSIVAFDSSNAQKVTFNVVGGSQVVGSVLTIKNNTTLAVVSTITTTSYVFEATIPANTLTNGVQYQATIKTKDSVGNFSSESVPVQFWCYTTPSWAFSNIPTGNIIENSSFSFNVTYNQIQGELLNSYVYNLYTVGGVAPISTSGTLYNSSSALPLTLSYLFGGFDNSSSYQIECIGQTVQGTQITTGKIQFSVSYVQPSAFAILELTNNCQGGYIGIKSNIAAIDGKSNPSPPIYLENKEVDLRQDGSWVLWDEGFSINGDFSAGIWGRNFNINKDIAIFSNTDGDKFTITYRQGYLNDDNTTPLQSYVEMYVTNFQSGTSYYIYSNYISPPNANEQLFVYLRRIGGIYELQLTNRGVIV